MRQQCDAPLTAFCCLAAFIWVLFTMKHCCRIAIKIASWLSPAYGEGKGKGVILWKVRNVLLPAAESTCFLPDRTR